MTKRMAVFSEWTEMINVIPPIEELEIAGTNRHRKECFAVAVALTRRDPVTVEEFTAFMSEYVRQLVGPEIYDTYNSFQTASNVKQAFRIIRKYTLGA